MLIERGVIVARRATAGSRPTRSAAVEIPETLHGLLLARIDQLPDAAKRSLRIAAVIGRQFPVRVLERVLGERSAVDDDRATPSSTRSRPRASSASRRCRPELEYLFRHALVQDAAYGSLLKQERRELHGQVGEALEELYPERVGRARAGPGDALRAGRRDREGDRLLRSRRPARAASRTRSRRRSPPSTGPRA